MYYAQMLTGGHVVFARAAVNRPLVPLLLVQYSHHLQHRAFRLLLHERDAVSVRVFDVFVLLWRVQVAEQRQVLSSGLRDALLHFRCRRLHDLRVDTSRRAQTPTTVVLGYHVLFEECDDDVNRI